MAVCQHDLLNEGGYMFVTLHSREARERYTKRLLSAARQMYGRPTERAFLASLDVHTIFGWHNAQGVLAWNSDHEGQRPWTANLGPKAFGRNHDGREGRRGRYVKFLGGREVETGNITFAFGTHIVPVARAHIMLVGADNSRDLKQWRQAMERAGHDQYILALPRREIDGHQWPKNNAVLYGWRNADGSDLDAGVKPRYFSQVGE